jgi:hypothetical protein
MILHTFLMSCSSKKTWPSLSLAISMLCMGPPLSGFIERGGKTSSLAADNMALRVPFASRIHPLFFKP